MHKFIIRGTRGSVPVCRRTALKHGGATTCFTLETDSGLIVIDAGTGITSAAGAMPDGTGPLPITILFTHFHLDHLVGLPLFAPLYRSDARVTFMGDPRRDDDWQKTLHTLFAQPYWPTNLTTVAAFKSFENLPVEAGSMELYGIRVSWRPLSHPQGCLAYRLECPDRTIVVATANEHAPSDVSAQLAGFCRGADSLVFDAMYTPAEYETRAGWGHSTWQQAVGLAAEAGVGELILTHHSASRADNEIDGIVAEAREIFPRTRAATENMVV